MLAASDGKGVLTEQVSLKTARGAGDGHYIDQDGTMVGFALTPGYETYRGLGWYGVILQTLPAAAKT